MQTGWQKWLMIFGCIWGNSAWAGQGVGQVTVVQLAMHSKIAVFSLDGEHTSRPRCNDTNRFAVHLDEPGGEVMFNALLEAKHRGYKVRVIGDGTCRNEWKAEDSKILVLE